VLDPSFEIQRVQDALQGTSSQAGRICLDPTDSRFIHLCLVSDSPTRPTSTQPFTPDCLPAGRGGRERVVSQELDDRWKEPNSDRVSAGFPVSQIPGSGSEDLRRLFLLKAEIQPAFE
jgi:hypothetical protein